MNFGKEYSCLELKELEKELKLYVDSYIDKIYEDESKIVFKLHHPQQGKIFLIYNYPYLYLSKEYIKSETSKKSKLKELEHCKIKDIFQLGSDRIIVIEFYDEKKMVFELFSRGNIVVLDQTNKIVFQTNKTGGKKKTSEIYDLIPEINIFNISYEEFKSKVQNKSLVKALAKLIGSLYAEEIVFRTGYKKEETNFDTKKVYEEFQKLINDEPCFCVSDDAFYVRNLQTKKITKSFNRFSQMIEEVIKGTFDTKSNEVRKLERAIKIQKETIKLHKEEIEKLQKAIEYIYSNFNDFQMILNNFQKNEFLDISQMNEQIKDLNIRIKDINHKEKKIIIEFDDSLFKE